MDLVLFVILMLCMASRWTSGVKYHPDEFVCGRTGYSLRLPQFYTPSEDWKNASYDYHNAELTCQEQGLSLVPIDRPELVQCIPKYVSLLANNTGLTLDTDVYLANPEACRSHPVNTYYWGAQGVIGERNISYRDTARVMCLKLDSECPTLTTVKNGDIVYENVRRANTLAWLRCHAGFVPIGNKVVSCGTTRSWNATLAVCSPPFCPAPPSPINGFVILEDKGAVGTSAFIRCKAGYQANGQDTLRCGENLLWSTPVATCGPQQTRTSCPKLKIPNGAIATEETTDGVVIRVEFECVTSNLSGAPTLTCNTDGQWSDMLPSCGSGGTFLSMLPLKFLIPGAALTMIGIAGIVLLCWCKSRWNAKRTVSRLSTERLSAASSVSTLGGQGDELNARGRRIAYIDDPVYAEINDNVGVELVTERKHDRIPWNTGNSKPKMACSAENPLSFSMKPMAKATLAQPPMVGGACVDMEWKFQAGPVSPGGQCSADPQAMPCMDIYEHHRGRRARSTSAPKPYSPDAACTQHAVKDHANIDPYCEDHRQRSASVQQSSLMDGC